MSETPTITPTDFLLARIAEDERHARKLAESETRPVLALAVTVNHPARILAECEAKRRVVVLHGRPHRCRMWDFEGVTDRRDPCDTLRFLALPYADHDDYREEWRP